MRRKDPKEDDDFFEDLCNQYFERIYNYCNRLVKGEKQLTDFVEECTQTTFLEARKQISALKKHPNAEGWLYTTARNLMNHSYRNLYIRKRHEVPMDDDISNTLSEEDHEMEAVFNGAVDLNKAYLEALNGLNKKEYELYADYFINNMSVSDLSQKYNVSSTATTTRIYRVKRKIKNLVHDYFKENDF